MKRLEGKHALVTGGTSGIGLAAARLFVANGARVAVTGRDGGKLPAVREQLGEGNLVLQSDTAKLPEIDRLYATLAQQFGALDVIFANAGISDGGSIEKTTEADFDRIFDINVKGLFFTVQKALPLLRSGASIVLNASIAPRVGRPDHTLYAASKAAVRTFARNFSSELAARGIRVNVVSPGPIETPIWTRAGSDTASIDALKRQVGASVPMGRLGKAEEVARAVLFLASDDSSYMLGTEVTVDGGVTEVRNMSFVPPKPAVADGP